MGVFPRVARWNDDELPDLIVGLADGRIALHLNVGVAGAPLFDTGQFLQAGLGDLDAGARATPAFVDWNDDGRRDLVVGALDGLVRVYVNEGTDTAPIFPSYVFSETREGALSVSTARSSPDVLDFDDDGRPDLVSGNTAGELAVYRNVGTAAAPLYDFFDLVTSEGAVIDLDGSARSRPASCDWNLDGHADWLVGGVDGRVRLYMGYEGNVVAVQGPVVAAARLLAPWPNPFNPAVNLTCELETPSRATLAIYDVAGREVARLLGGEQPAGRHVLRWRGQDGGGRDLPAGLYFARLITPRRSETRKLMLLR